MRQPRTAQSTGTQGYLAHFRKNHNRLLLGNWNVLIFIGKDLEFVEKASRYFGASSTKRCGSGIVDLDGGWKLFYSDAGSSMSAQAGVGILTSPQLSDCVIDCNTLENGLYIEAQNKGLVRITIAGICA